MKKSMIALALIAGMTFSAQAANYEKERIQYAKKLYNDAFNAVVDWPEDFDGITMTAIDFYPNYFEKLGKENEKIFKKDLYQASFDTIDHCIAQANNEASYVYYDGCAIDIGPWLQLANLYNQRYNNTSLSDEYIDDMNSCISYKAMDAKDSRTKTQNALEAIPQCHQEFIKEHPEYQR